MIDTMRTEGIRVTESFIKMLGESKDGFFWAVDHAIPIVADNVLPHYFEAEDRGLDHMPSLMPPFEVNWVEARFGRGLRFGMLYMKGSNILPEICQGAAHVAVCLLFVQAKNGAVYGPEIQIDLPLDERGYFMPEESTRMGMMATGDRRPFGMSSRSEDSVLRFGTNPKGYSVSMKDWIDEPDNREASYEAIKALLFAVGMMNCSNVGTVMVVPPAKLSKKREKRYGKPLIRYRVIQVKPHLTTRGAKHSAERATVGEHTPLHICRGHFKTYEEDRPLLGKHTGTFWWKSQVRGSKSAGEIHHEYVVE
jgi:hypothetical protein